MFADGAWDPELIANREFKVNKNKVLFCIF